jgi:hypothetical protein
LDSEAILGFGTTPQERDLQPMAQGPKLSIRFVPAPFRSFFTQDWGYPNGSDFPVNVFPKPMRHYYSARELMSRGFFEQAKNFLEY